METFSRTQQLVVLIIIFGMSLLYFQSINQPSSSLLLHQGEGWGEGGAKSTSSKPATDHRLLTTKKLSGAKLLTLNKPINLNTATVKDLEAIPGIGPKTAENIISYRKRYGRFERAEDVMKVQGIKQKRFERIKRYLTV